MNTTVVNTSAVAVSTAAATSSLSSTSRSADAMLDRLEPGFPFFSRSATAADIARARAADVVAYRPV
jgi:hypothetical protein